MTDKIPVPEIQLTPSDRGTTFMSKMNALAEAMRSAITAYNSQIDAAETVDQFLQPMLSTIGFVDAQRNKIEQLPADALAASALAAQNSNQPIAGVPAASLVQRIATAEQRIDELPAQVDAAGTAAALLTTHNHTANAHPELSSFISSEANRASEAAEISVGAANQLGFATWADLSATSGSAVGQMAQVVGDSGTHIDHVSGLAVHNSGRYGWTGAAWQWLGPDVLAQKSDRTAVDTVVYQQSALNAALGITTSVVEQYGVDETNSPFPTATFRGWQFGISVGADYPADTNLARVTVPGVTIGAAVSMLRVAVYLRPQAGIDVNAPAPNISDTTHIELGLAVGDLGLTPGALAPAEIDINLPPISAAALAGRIVIVSLLALDADSNSTSEATIGIGRAVADDSTVPAYKRGHYLTSGGWTAISGYRIALAAYSEQISVPIVEQLSVVSAAAEAAGQAASAASSEASSASAEVDRIMATGEFATELAEVGGVIATNQYPVSSFTGWAWGADAGIELPASREIKRLRMPRMVLGETVERVTLVVHRRLKNSESLNAPPPAASDVLLFTRDYSPSEIGVVAGATAYSTGSFECLFAVPSDSVAMIQLLAFDGQDARAGIGIGRTAADNTAVPQRSRGWWRTTGLYTAHENHRIAFAVDAEELQSVTQIEVAAARGIAPSLADRLFRSMDASGSPRRSFGAAAMRQYRFRRQKLTLPVKQAAQNVIGLFGTSWTQNPLRWSGGFAEMLYAEQGEAAVGFVSFAWQGTTSGAFVDGGSQPTSINGHALREVYKPVWHGAWTSPAYGEHSTPDCSIAQSSTAGDYIRLPINRPCTRVTLYWLATTDGVIEYSFNGTTWTSLSVQGAVVGNCYFANLAGGSGTITDIHIRVVSGVVKLGGVNAANSAGVGAVVMKFAVGGKGANHLAPIAARADWRAAIANLGLNTADVMHGTNDQGATVSGAFAANMAAIASSLRAAIPAIDICLSVEAENARQNNSRRMVDMALDVARVAADAGYGFYDTQDDFGSADNPTWYQAAANGGTLPLFNSADLFHPDPATGGPILIAAKLRFFNYTL